MPPKKVASAAGSRPFPAAVGIGFHLREAYRAFSRDFHARLARHGITHAQWLMLWFLSQAGSLKLSSLLALGFILFVISFIVLAISRLLLRPRLKT